MFDPNEATWIGANHMEFLLREVLRGVRIPLKMSICIVTAEKPSQHLMYVGESYPVIGPRMVRWSIQQEAQDTFTWFGIFISNPKYGIEGYIPFSSCTNCIPGNVYKANYTIQ